MGQFVKNRRKLLRLVFYFFMSIPSMVKRSEKTFISFHFEAKQSKKTFISFCFEAKTKIFWKRNKAKIRCIYFALVGSEKFEAKRSEMKRKNNNFFSRERAKRMRNGSRFASFRFEAKKFLKRNRRTLLRCQLTALIGAARICSTF